MTIGISYRGYVSVYKVLYMSIINMSHTVPPYLGLLFLVSEAELYDHEPLSPF